MNFPGRHRQNIYMRFGDMHENIYILGNDNILYNTSAYHYHLIVILEHSHWYKNRKNTYSNLLVKAEDVDKPNIFKLDSVQGVGFSASCLTFSQISFVRATLAMVGNVAIDDIEVYELG